jgi:hypothetical protein
MLFMAILIDRITKFRLKFEKLRGDDDSPNRYRYNSPNTPHHHKDRKPRTADNKKRRRGTSIYKRDASCILPARIGGYPGNRFSAPNCELRQHRVRRQRLSQCETRAR